MNQIKQFLKNIISSVLIITVLLPFAVQFIHSFEHHEHICSENDIHVDTHKLNCAAFHFKINQNTIDFISEEISLQKESLENYIPTLKEHTYPVQLYYKSSRGPPFLLL